MELNYGYLKENIVRVEVLEDLNMGQWNGLYDTKDEISQHLNINNQGDLIIPKGTIALFNVQPFNYHFEMTFKDGQGLDVCFDDDSELNNYIKFIGNEGVNRHFMKEA